MGKPVWEEEWAERLGEAMVRVAPDRWRPISLETEDVLVRRARARLAAAAPSLVRALLAVEWTDSALPQARATVAGVETPFVMCPVCAALWGRGARHRDGCATDAALRAAGLETQAERDEARKAIGQ